MTHSQRPSYRPGKWVGLTCSTGQPYKLEAEVSYKEWLAVRDRQIQILCNLSLDGVILVDSSGYCVSANLAACQLFGRPMPALVGQLLAALIASETEFTYFWQQLLQQEQYQAHLSLVQPGGTVRLLPVSACANFFPHYHLFLFHRMAGLEEDAKPSARMQLAETSATELGQHPENRDSCQIFERSPQRQAEQERRLGQVIQAIRSSLDLSIIFSVAADQISEFLNGEVSIVKYYPERHCWVHQEVSKRGERQEHKLNLEIPDQGNPIADQLKQLQRVHIDNTSTLLDPINRALAEGNLEAWLMTPIVVGGALWGSLTLGRSQIGHPWSEEEMAMAQRLADQLAIAIQQSELHEQVQQLNTHLERLNTQLEQQVQERTRQLEQTLEFEGLVRRITDKVRDSLDEHQILQTVVEELALALELECCDTGIYNADKTVSTIVCESTRSLKSVRGESIRIAEACYPEIYQCLFAGQVCQICDRLPDTIREDQTHLTILACPIFDDQDVLGDLWLFRRIGQVFTEQEVRLAIQVATQCAIALRQARLYQMARIQVTELERLHQIKDDFLSAVTHELRSPMSNIKMSTEMLEIQLSNLGILQPADAPNPSNPSTQRYFTILKEECQREVNLINDLLDLARVEAGREILAPMAIQLYLWVSHIVETFTERAQQQNLGLQVYIPQDLIIKTDLSCLERILSELLHNACKYTPSGETITIHARSLGRTLEIAIWNTGVEIPESEQERIFEKFYRIPGSDPMRHGGTGLGLSLVRELALYLGGQIQVQSGDRSTGFILTLPAP